MKVSVIISTYNNPAWLEKVLWGYECQTHPAFEVVIADDGSAQPTFDLIDKFKKSSALRINHVWHEDRGFQKSEILNKATLAAEGEYLIYSDGDCIPRKDFVETHVRYAEKGYFLSGGYYMLSMDVSKAITREDVVSQRVFEKGWLYRNGQPRTFKSLKLTARGWFARFMNAITPTNASWNGHNASGWKTDIVQVNGYNEEMQYGGQDRELGERLNNIGIRGKQIRYSAVCVHLDHKRGYKTDDSIRKNKAIRRETVSTKRTWTPHGILKS